MALLLNEYPYSDYQKINLDWLLDLGNKLKSDAESGAFNGADGEQGERGYGVYGGNVTITSYSTPVGGSILTYPYTVLKTAVQNAAVNDFIVGNYDGLVIIFKVNVDIGERLAGFNALTLTGPQGPKGDTGDVSQSTIESMTLGIDSTDGLVYLYVNGVKQGTGIAIGDVPPAPPTEIYADLVVSDSVIQVAGGNSGSFNVRLSEQPTQNQTVSIYGNGVVTSVANLLFTTGNWNTPQTVSFTTSAVDDTTTAYVTLINSDPLMTETSITVTITAPGYDSYVDTTIPTEGMHTVTADDFTATSVFGDYIRLNGYNANYTNIYIPATINGKIPWLTCENGTYPNSKTFGTGTIQYVTFADGVIYRGAGTTSGCNASNLFSGCTSLIGVSNMNPAVTNLSSAFNGCTSLEFVDNLPDLVNVTSDYMAFSGCTSLEYVQDLSDWTAVGLSRTFRGCSNLKKIFGLPNPSSAATFEYAFMGTQVEKVTIPANASSLVYCFNQNTHVNNVTILADGLTTTNLNSIFGSSQTQNIDVYANANSTTYASLQSMFASSTKVTVHDLSGSSLPSIVVWGDSTSSPNRPWIEWPARLQTKLGTNDYLVKNEAVSGEWTTSTSARQGGNAIHTNAFAIPATTTAALVTLITADNQTFSNAPIFNPGGSFNPCQIAGIEGVISRDGANYYFTRSADGTGANVNSGAIVTSDKDTEFNASGNVMLVNIGHNSGWNGDAATLVNQMQLMVNHFIALGGTDYIITGPWSGTWISTDSGWAVTQQVNTLASTAFGNHWLNLPADMAANCQTDNPGVTWTTEDLAYIAAGKTPLPSLTYDNTHPTEAGANSQMMAFYRKGVALGYWT